MQERKIVGRREFTVASAMAVLSGVAITVTGCGGSSSSGGSPTTPSTPATPAPAPSADKVGTVASNHGHSAVIEAAKLASPEEVSLDITGTSSHPHTVALSADEVERIGAGTRVSKESSTDASHSHTVTFN